MELRPTTWVHFFVKLEVILAHSLVGVIFPIRVVVMHRDLSPEWQLEHVFNLRGDADAEDCHADLCPINTYVYFGVVGAPRRVESVRQLNF